MERIDLHVHSCCSDGTLTPTELVSHAAEQQLSAFALTDHDTVEGVAEALHAAKGKSLQVIPGVELSVDYKGKEIHILGYQIDYTDAHLRETLEKVTKERDNRNRKMTVALTEGGYPISYEELIDTFGDVVITRAHFAKLLLKKGLVESMDEAFRGCLNNKSPYFINRRYLTPEEAMKLIQDAGGIPVLAHPLLYKMSVTELNELLTYLEPLGLKGIEAIYSCNRGNDEAFCKKLAFEHNLFITGGSDFHGANKPHIEMGTGMGKLYVDKSLLKNIEK